MPPSEKGSRLIINDAFFIPLKRDNMSTQEFNAKLGTRRSVTHLVNSDNKSYDYHDTMNSECWLEWFETKLLPEVETGTLIHVDRATYHLEVMPETKIPTTSSLKQVQQDWLNKHNIP